MRIGHGYDVHAFGQGDALILGGVEIPFNRAFIAHSDGDVLIHALIDALLGSDGCIPDEREGLSVRQCRHYARGRTTKNGATY